MVVKKSGLDRVLEFVESIESGVCLLASSIILVHANRAYLMPRLFLIYLGYIMHSFILLTPLHVVSRVISL